ncbi:hypothetical protein ACHAWO_007944 [Cyclotella atomus]|uniref:Uncharacterized protein n=1 Tax=Cyclotella atomus TaxID=382360 RepID=A0ABD3PD29_9STRA
MFSLLFYSSKQAVLINMKLSPLFTTIIVALSVSSAMARRTGRGWNRDDDDWWGVASKSSKTAQPTFYPTLSPTLSGKSSKSWWGGWKDDGDDDWKGWRGYNHKKQHKKKLHHEKKRNGHRNHWGRDLVGEDLDAANEVAVDKEVLDLSGK